ncbi:MAG: hypothetical protein HY878_02890, partial [Deltaproteobacteria bacterium]|nr:hypothetical protein [Deltaproteobacteria bacterium]
KKLARPDVPIYVFHMKPQYLEVIKKELSLMDNTSVRLLKARDTIEF